MSRLSQIKGVGQVTVGGSSLPAVRIDVNPTHINSFGLQLENVRTAVAAATSNEAKGAFADSRTLWSIHANDQLLKAVDFRPLIVAYRNGSPIRLSDVASVQDSVQTVRSLGTGNGKPAALLIIFRQPGANIIATVDGVKTALPQLRAAINQSIVSVRVTASFFGSAVLMKWERGPGATSKKASAAPESDGSRSVGSRV
jgi:multidrug efflux pump